MTLPRVHSRSAAPLAGGQRAVEPAGAGALHVVTFGCQMNKYDSELVEGRFRRRGWRTTADAGEADVVLFNTCSVRDHAEERVWSWVGELKRAKERRPELVIGVLGCMAQRVGEEVFRRAGHVDLVVGTRAFQHLPDLVDDLRRRRAQGASAARSLALAMDQAPDAPREGEPFAGGLHGYLAVMRGCDLSCAFCVVPATRGRVLSRPAEDVLREARWMVAGGARAITLLGQTVNSYGEDLPAPGPGGRRGLGRQGRPGLADLLYGLQEIDGLARVRLITLHPSYATASLARALAECDKCERFLPLPAQSGSDRVLKAMKRGYTTDLYRRRADLLRERVPDLELGSDWIVGFPGEGEADFAASEAFLAEQRFALGYVFKYSPRPDTRAGETLPDDVPEEVKKERNQRLLRASEASALARMRAQIGRPVRALVEARAERGHLQARTQHGLPLALHGPDDLLGRVVDAIPQSATAYGLAGVVA